MIWVLFLLASKLRITSWASASVWRMYNHYYVRIIQCEVTGTYTVLEPASPVSDPNNRTAAATVNRRGKTAICSKGRNIHMPTSKPFLHIIINVRTYIVGKH